MFNISIKRRIITNRQRIASLSAFFLFCAPLRAQVTYLDGSVNKDNQGGIFNIVLLGNGNAVLTNPESARSADTNTYAKLVAAKSSVILTLGSADSRLHMRSSTGNLAANSTTYVRLYDKPLNSGLTLDVGALLGLGGQAAGISGGAYSGATNPSGTSPYGMGTEVASTTQLLQNKHGTYFFSIRPSQPYNAVQIRATIPSSGLLNLADLSTLTVHVVHAFQEPDSTYCSAQPRFTDLGSQSGLSLNLSSIKLIDLGSALSNTYLAIDDSETTYSVMKGTAANLNLGTTAQTVYFDHVVSANDSMQIMLAIPTGLITASLLNKVSFSFLNNDNLVNTIDLATSLLGIDLLSIPIIGGYRTVTVRVKSSGAYNQGRISLESLVDLSVIGNGLRIYDIRMVPYAPGIIANPVNDTICLGNNGQMTVQATLPVTSYQWQTYSGSSWTNIPGATAASLHINNPGIGTSGTRYRVLVSGGNNTCQLSTSSEAVLTIQQPPGPIAPTTTFQ